MWQNDDVHLSTVCQLQTFINKEEKLEQKKLGLEEKKELLKAIENKSQKECEREFAKISPEIAKTQESSRAVTEDLTRITLTATSEMMAEFEEIKSLLSHKNINGFQELFREMAKITLQKLRVKEPKATSAEKVTSEKSQEVSAAAEVKTPTQTTLTNRKYNSVETKRIVWHRAQGSCQYIDLLTNRKCNSRHKLQYDHITPSAVGGLSTPDNLRLLCSTHNRIMAIHFYGEKKMRPYLKL